MGVNGDTVVTITHEDIIYQHVITTHQINSVAPSFATERFQILYSQSINFSAKDCVMVGIHYGDSINQYIFRVSDFDATNRMVEYSPTYDTYILRMVYQQLRLYHCSRSQIDSRVGRNPDLCIPLKLHREHCRFQVFR